MHDPLIDFRWASLTAQYDARCRGFDSSSDHLAVFGTDRPDSDRSLYHRLVVCYSPAGRAAQTDPSGTYEALLYWKYYSQGTADRNIAMLGAPGSDGRQQSEKALRRALAALPATLDKSVEAVVGQVRGVSLHSIPCMGLCALPTKTTLLHFAYPEVVPIFDKQVLKAVGAPGSGNHSYRVLKQYLPFAWGLASRYAPNVASGSVSALRAVDMALWVHRGVAAARIA